MQCQAINFLYLKGKSKKIFYFVLVSKLLLLLPKELPGSDFEFCQKCLVLFGLGMKDRGESKIYPRQFLVFKTVNISAVGSTVRA
jgi:hypothetical protein